jgi:TonB-linked SusC/RagA family outer membrane protein
MMKQKRLLLWMLGFLSLVFLSTTSWAQEVITVKGTVIDKSQKSPLAGATVKQVGGTGKATAADANGNFEISVPANSRLTITMTGYQPITVLAKSAKLSIELDVSAKDLDDVVVVGYSKVKKELLTGSVASMKISETELELPTTSVSNLLAGKMAGVDVGTPNGIPGSAAGITIRTASSFNAQNVLFVIDDKISGQGDFNNLSPNEIDNITVLKDAATTAAYGSRGAGGVVVVTTKRGKAGTPTFSYSYNTGYDKRSKNMPLTSAVDMAQMYNRQYASVSGAVLWQQSDIDYFKNNDFGGGYGYGFNMLDDVYRDPYTRTQNLSVSGGSDKIKYFVGGSYVKQEGFLKGLDFKKYNIRANITANLTNNFELFAGATINNNLTYSIPSTAIGDASGNYAKLLVWQPYLPLYTKSGKAVDYGWIGNMGSEVNGLGGYSNNNNLKPVFTLSGTYKLPIAGLKAKANFVKSYTNFRSKTFVKHYQVAIVKQPTPYVWGLEDGDITGYKFSNQNLGDEYLSETMTWSNDQQLNLQLNYDTTFGRHHIS